MSRDVLLKVSLHIWHLHVSAASPSQLQSSTLSQIAWHNELTKLRIRPCGAGNDPKA